MGERIVIKVGGSLYDEEDLGLRLRAWIDALAARGAARVALVPGGGPTADVIRRLDRCHRLGQERAHWLALSALALNALFLADLLPGAVVVEDESQLAAAWSAGKTAILQARAFLAREELCRSARALPHTWEASSDSVAAHLARGCNATRLVLLKSVPIPSNLSIIDAARQGIVDPLFAALVHDAPFVTQLLCFRTQAPGGANLA